MYTVSALFDITVPFFVFAPPNENTFRRPCLQPPCPLARTPRPIMYLRRSEATEPERAERARGEGVGGGLSPPPPPTVSLKDRVQKVVTSVSSREKIKMGKTKLYKNLKKHEIIDELHERDISFH